MRVKEFSSDRWGFALGIQSNDDDDQDGNMLHIHVGPFNAYIETTTRFIKAKEEIVKPDWDAKTIARLGRDYYIKYTRKDYGFSYYSDFGHQQIHVHYGIQPGNWTRDDPENSDHTKVLNFPWNIEHVRHSVYFNDGSYACNGSYFHQWEFKKNGKSITKDMDQVARETLFKSVVPFEFPKDDTCEYGFVTREHPNIWSGVTTDKPVYDFYTFSDPYDESKTLAKVNIEEREWVRGKWAWLRALLKYVPYCRIIRREMGIEFLDPVGYRKHDWKGGITGMSYSMLKGEYLYATWLRFINDEKQMQSLKTGRRVNVEA